MKNLGQINFRWQVPSGSLTFANSQTLAGVACSTIVSSANFATAGAAIGDRVFTNSGNAGNKGPFIIIGISTVTLYVVLPTGVAPTFTAGVEATDTIGTSILQCMLTRSGFIFNPATYKKLINFKNVLSITSSGNTITITGLNTIALNTGAFVAAGFVAGNSITFSGFAVGANNITAQILSVSDTQIVLTANVLTNAVESTNVVTFTTTDELASGNGYSTWGLLSGVPILTEDDVHNYGKIAIPNIVWTAAVGSIGPTASMIIVDLATSDQTIVGNLNFGVDQTAVAGTTITVAGGTLLDA
jgi:hypothetical protein